MKKGLNSLVSFYDKGKKVSNANLPNESDESFTEDVEEDPSQRAQKLWSVIREKRGLLTAHNVGHYYVPQRQYRPPYMIDPESKYKSIWDLVIAFLVLYTTCIVPFRVGFNRAATGILFYFEAAGDVLFFLDIVANFRTGFTDPKTGNVRYQKKLIAKNYLKGSFFIDCISTCPFEHLVPLFSGAEAVDAAALRTAKLARVFKIARLLRLRKLKQIMNRAEDRSLVNPSAIELLKVVLGVLFVSHIMACLWFYCAYEDLENSWAAQFSDETQHDPALIPLLQYVASIYWSLSTMTTVGYGDIVAVNDTERLVSIFVMVISVSVFGYVIGNIATLVENLNAEGRLRNQQMTMIKEYLISRRLPKAVMTSVREHFEYFYAKRSVFDENGILEKLPDALRVDMIHYVYADTITGITFLRSCREAVAAALAVNMHPSFALEEENVYAEHEIAAHVYFLRRGVVELTKSFSDKALDAVLSQFGAGQHFGELEVFSRDTGNGVRISTASAQVYCEMLFISRRTLVKLEVLHPEIIEYFTKVAQEMATKVKEEEGAPVPPPPVITKSSIKKMLSIKKKTGKIAPVLTDPTPKRKGLPPLVTASSNPFDNIASLDENQVVEEEKVTDDSKARNSLDAIRAKDRRFSFEDMRTEAKPAVPRRKSSVYDSKVKNTLLVRMGSGRKTRQLDHQFNVLHHQGILHPQETIRVQWDIILTIAIIYSTIAVPYRIGFESMATGSMKVFENCLDIFFFLDILVNFQTAYFDNDRRLVYNRRKISLRYLRTHFVLDLLSTIPVDLVEGYLTGGGNEASAFRSAKLLKVLRLTRLLKLVRLLKVGKMFTRIKEIMQINPSAESLLKLMTILCFFGHWNACFFHWIMLSSESSGQRTWCTDYFFETYPDLISCSTEISASRRYLAAMYWALATMTTVGFGDVSANLGDINGLFITMVSMLINATVFGYVVSGVMSVIQNYDPQSREYNVKMNELKYYMRHTAIQSPLSKMIKKHYEYYLNTKSLFPEQEIFDSLRPNLRFEIAQLICNKSILSIPIIGSVERVYKGFASYILFLLRPMLILQGEHVCFADTPGMDMYFLVHGECQQRRDSNSDTRILSEGAQFEQYALLAPQSENYRVTYTTTALSNRCLLYAFSKADFVSLKEVANGIVQHFAYLLASAISNDMFIKIEPHQKSVVDAGLALANSLNIPKTSGNMGSIMSVALAKLRKIKKAERDSLTGDALDQIQKRSSQTSSISSEEDEVKGFNDDDEIK